MGTVAVVDYGAGNLHSVRHALEMAGGDVVMAATPEDLCAADRIVLPGVGAFGECMANLRASGLIPVLEEQVFQRAKPLLGICVGFQLMAAEGLEMGRHAGLGWLPAVVDRLDAARHGLRLPHVGWNEVVPVGDVPLFAGMRRDPTFYFTHSYRVMLDTPQYIAGETEYGGAFTAAAMRDTIVATQFHPEKSQQNGLTLLENFLRWNP